ncbi:CBS domain-containing protein [Lutibacter sp. B1]|uniref:CBS domain-containing protein n=1 Tax=Lutibacter sp. B1 TaxID=2725996 RepID=UPI0014569FFF|nr:CBS domain-containing protein [Lutibacter sp. B1]NLP58620.1 CBS domain-containing protein [Lutibacter sp. B1]
METTSYILKEFKPFTLHTKFADVKSFFYKTTYSHFPIVHNNQLLGLISEADIQGIDESKELGDFQYLFNLFFAEENNNLLEIIKIFASNEANLIPVTTTKNSYLGYYDLIDMLHIYNDTTFLKNEGAVLSIEKELKDYSFSEICQIVESNNGKVLGLFIAESSPSLVKITLKFNAQDINEIIQSLRRYNYNVLTKHKEDFYFEDLKERSEYLQKYLNI